MSNFKWMKFFVKVLTYGAIGGILAFTICALSLYVQAMGVAKDISRNYVMQVCADGCSNYEQRTQYYTGLVKAYTSKYIVIAGSTEDGADENVNNYNPVDYSTGKFMPDVNERYLPSDLDNASKLALKAEANGVNLDNSKDQDYIKCVQRGTPISVTATIRIRYFLPFKIGIGHDTTYTDGTIVHNEGQIDGGDEDFKSSFIDGKYYTTISATTVGISTRYFKDLT